METIKYFVGGEYRESKTTKFNDIYNPSTGEVVAKAPCCTKEEVEEAIAIAKEAYKTWSQVPVIKRAQVMYKVRELIIKYMDELTVLVSQEHGKVLSEAHGDVLKAQEGTELACSIPTLM
ncbi:methylmalonate-semialdehyde dehydrogenase (CoA acylating), partial [Lachnotalea glycerini]